MPLDVFTLKDIDDTSPSDPIGSFEAQKEPAPEEKPPSFMRDVVGKTAADFGKQVAAAGETALAVGTGMALWPISKLRGVGELMRGKSAEEAKATEEEIAGMAYQPRIESAREATELVGKGIDLALTPARMTGEGVTEIVGPRAGYVADLAAELAMFKVGHAAKVKGIGYLKERTVAKKVFNKKMSALTEAQRAEVTRMAAMKIKKPPRDLIKEQKEGLKTEFEKSYETQKDIWFKGTDGRIFDANVEARLLKKELKQITKKTPYDPKQLSEAVQIYIDTKRNPEHIEKYYDNLTPEQQKTVNLSQNLPENVRGVIDKIEKSYAETGIESLDADVIRNLQENYVNRIWDLKEPKRSSEVGRKFGTTSRHSKARKFDTILEGWANGYDLKVKDAVSNLRIYKEEMVKTIEDKKFLSELRKIKDVDGNPLLSTQQLEGYVEIEHPNFKVWEWAGEVEPTKTYGKNFFSTEDGTLFERRSLYAPKKQAKNLNNMLGTSKLADVAGVRGTTKFNAIAKAWILQSSLFHHFAFARSYYLGTNHKRFGEMSFRGAYREGIKFIESSDPVVRHGVENGLTLGLQQDWEANLLREKTYVGKVLDKNKVTKGVKDAVTGFREAQADFLFGEIGAGLKAKSYMIEFRNQVKKYPTENPDVIAKRVARLINDDFGGLHLKRMGRNPTLQHIFRLAALAPDWTESNIRTIVKTLKNKTGDARELYLYQKFWGGVVVKGLGATALMNYAMAGGDVKEMKDKYDRAWKEGNFNWAKVDITPIYKMLGGEGKDPRYFSVLGHFLDPAKFITHPVKSAHHKGSVVYGAGHEALVGADWAGRKFTTFEELLDTGETVKWGPGSPISYEQFPAYALSQIIGMQPIQVQNFIGWANGEIDEFDAISRSLGIRTTRGYSEPQSNKLKTLSGLKE